MTAGDALYCLVVDGGGPNESDGCSDSQGNTWKSVATVSLSTDEDTVTLACAIAGTSGADTVSFMLSGTVGKAYGNIYQVHNSTCTLDVPAVSSNTQSVTSCNSGPLTTLTANDLLIGECGATHGPEVAGSGWSDAVTSGYGASTPAITNFGELQVASTIGSYTAASGNFFPASVGPREQATLEAAFLAVVGTQPALTPAFSPGAGTYTSAQTVTISDTTPGATIYYTTDGSTPTVNSAKYSGAISVSTPETLEAIATATGYLPSAVGSAFYNFGTSPAATPTFSPAAGTFSSTQNVTISDSTPGATIYYTTDGSRPTVNSAKYSGAISVSISETVNAIVTATGYLQSAVGSAAYTIVADAAIDWTNVYQVIDGFGASDAWGKPLTSAPASFFFGTGTGQLGLSILRTAVPNSGDISGDCATVNSGCAGPYVSDMQAAIADGARIYSSPWSPPANYKTNGSTDCSNSSDGLITSDYGPYATWLANYAQSLQTYDGITLYALSVQNEPDQCQSYDSAIWTAANIDTFVASNLGPAFSSDGLSTLIFVPEASEYGAITLGDTCAGDSSCNQYVGGINWHEYDASLSGTNTVAPDPYPSTWPAGKKYWETEASCGSNFGPNFCQSSFTTDITDALDWAAVIDQRIAVDGANAWLYWWLIDSNSTDNQGLEASDGTIAQRAYMLGQYSKFVRPGYYRIGALHLPQRGVSVTAYRDTVTNTLVIVATNYSSFALSQTFTIENAPSFLSVTPTTTSASLNLAQQPSVAVSSNSFTYTLPAQSITTFVGIGN